MNEIKYYLREDAYFEPLVHNWYAWPYMIPPVTSAMLFSGRIMKLMKSFVKNYQLHIAASRNPGLVGGEFMNCSEEKVSDVGKLINSIELNYPEYMEIRIAITELNEYLEKNTSGFTLEKEYKNIPAILRGYVELVYNENNDAFFRFIEGLLYLGPLYKKESQSISIGLLSKVDARPFVLSTPRFADDDHMHINIDFSNQKIDQIMLLREIPSEINNIKKIFYGESISGGLSLSDIFTESPPSKEYEELKHQLRIKFLGHAGLCLECENISILVDPVIPSRNCSNQDKIISFSELPKRIDYVCLTHTHMDHVCIETLLQLRYKIGKILVPKNNGGTITDPSLKLMLKQLSFNVVEMEDMDEVNFIGGKICAIPFLGEHADLNIRSKTAWFFGFQDIKILSSADSSGLDSKLYEHIHKIIGDIDLLYLGMECVGAPMSWLYGSFFTRRIPREINESRRFNGADFQTAKKLVDILNPKEVYVYALGLEPWFKYFMGIEYDGNSKQIKESDRLIEFCKMKKITCERLFGARQWVF